MNFMKKILIWIVILAIGYFILGYLAVFFSWLSKDIYFNFSAIIGGIASVSGLLAFATNKLEKDDIDRVGIEYFKEMVASAEELKQKKEELSSKEKELSVKAKELAEINIKKAEMEHLVLKASMSLFLKDQLERIDSRLIEITEENKELKKLLTQRETVVKQISDINEEINENSNSKLINEIIEITKLSKSDKNKGTAISIFKSINESQTFMDSVLRTTVEILKWLK